jgi:hypothetical protein
MPLTYLRNYLPSWLDGILANYTGKITEINNQNIIHALNIAAQCSFHSINATPGNMAGLNGNGHHIWEYTHSNYWTYGKYLEYKGSAGTCQFWIGLYKTMNSLGFYLWFPLNKPIPAAVHSNLVPPNFTDETDTYDHWFRYNLASSLALYDTQNLQNQAVAVVTALLNVFP